MKLAIYDSGVRRTHVDFAVVTLTRVKKQGNKWVEEPYRGNDSDGHGTNVAGIMAAAANGIGIDGVVAPPLGRAGIGYQLQVYNANFFVEPPTDPNNPGDLDNWYTDVVQAIEAADQTNARVINISMRIDVESRLGKLPNEVRDGHRKRYKTLLSDFRTQVRMRRILVVLGAGNENKNVDTSDVLFSSINRLGPNENVIVVGGIGLDDNRWAIGVNGSNYGKGIDIAAPAHRLLIPALDGRRENADAESGYVLGSGTSLAAPFVSGAAALLFAIRPELTAAQVKLLLVNNALVVNVNIPDGRKQAWRTLKIADTVNALLPTMPGNLQPRSWSRLYAVSTTHGNPGGGIVRFPRVLRGQGDVEKRNTYVVPGTAEPVHASYAEFSSAHNGSFLAAAEVVLGLGIRQKIRGVPLRSIPLPPPPDTFAVSCGAYPALRPSEAMAFISDDCVDDNRQADLYLRLSTGSTTRLTTIAAPTSITYGGLTEAVPMVGTKFIFGPLTVSPDNRWIAFTPAQGGRLYLFFVKDGLEDIHPARVPETARRSNQNRFLAVANRNGTRLANVWFPAISPDGSRIAFVDTNTNKLRMALLRVADGAGDGVTLNFWEYTVDLELGVQLFSYPKLAWSPDGSKIIFAQNTEIHIVSGAAGDWTRAPGDPVPTVPTAKLVDAALTSNPSLEWVWRE